MLNKVLLIAGILFFLVQCGRPDDGVTIKVDMASQHDEGNFNPELGDRLALAGTINDWEPSNMMFRDEDGDWLYELKVPGDMMRAIDTLEFKLVMVSGQNRDLSNGGWETIVNRKIPKVQFTEKTPVLIFNKPWAASKTEDITFSVSMSNQQVLGFFDPQTDKVVVTGSFLGWDPQGVEMEDKDGDLIYEANMPIDITPNEPEQYKYRIVRPQSKSRGYLPYEGWEFIENRLLTGGQHSDIEVDYYNDQLRVARFMISEGWLRDSANVNVNKGDLLHIRLAYNDKEFITDPLVKTREGFYETSIELPLNMLKAEWCILKNYEFLEFTSRKLFLSQKGKIIKP